MVPADLLSDGRPLGLQAKALSLPDGTDPEIGRRVPIA